MTHLHFTPIDGSKAQILCGASYASTGNVSRAPRHITCPKCLAKFTPAAKAALDADNRARELRLVAFCRAQA